MSEKALKVTHPTLLGEERTEPGPGRTCEEARALQCEARASCFRREKLKVSKEVAENSQWHPGAHFLGPLLSLNYHSSPSVPVPSPQLCPESGPSSLHRSLRVKAALEAAGLWGQ